MNCEETNRKTENETQITATEERHEIIVLHVDGKKKDKDIRAVKKIERQKEYIKCMFFFSIKYSTNGTVKSVTEIVGNLLL